MIVRGISKNTTEDALLNYFENTRRSDGGQVEEVKITENTARVKFASSEGIFSFTYVTKQKKDDVPSVLVKTKFPSFSCFPLLFHQIKRQRIDIFAWRKENWSSNWLNLANYATKAILGPTLGLVLKLIAETKESPALK